MEGLFHAPGAREFRGIEMNLIEQVHSSLAHLGETLQGGKEAATEATTSVAAERRACRKRQPRVIFGVQGMWIPPRNRTPWWSDNQAR
jgi:hypothetical protein